MAKKVMSRAAKTGRIVQPTVSKERRASVVNSASRHVSTSATIGKSVAASTLSQQGKSAKSAESSALPKRKRG
jgi:hypothetical protein